MNVLLVLACVALVGHSLADKAQWEQFKNAHGKQYRSVVEEKVRYSIFEKNLERINEHNELYNQGEKTYTMGVNQFADLTKEEFLERLKTSKNSKPQLKSGSVFRAPLNVELPESVDWREKDAVTGVKDQGQCGSCWSFSTTGSLEGQNKIVNGKLVSLSEQVLMDCSWEQGNEGCDGGLMTSAFDYIIENGLGSEKDFPYKGIDRHCSYTKKQSVVSIKNYTVIKANDESDLQSAVATVGPVSIAIDATFNLQFYDSGLFSDPLCSADALNHGVLAVGYGSTDKGDYWLVKNSWGRSWGEKGYVRMSRNKNNQCGIAADACYPVL